jgi:hypothetical protein
MNGSVQETEEDQYQTHGSYYVNSFNIHNITLENCYNRTPVTRSSFFPLLLSAYYNLNDSDIVIFYLETSTDYRLTVTLSFSPVAGLVVSCILGIYFYGKECTILITS